MLTLTMGIVKAVPTVSESSCLYWSPSTLIHLADNLREIHRELATDLNYIVKSSYLNIYVIIVYKVPHIALQRVNNEYETKQNSGKYTESYVFT